jgi:hypothetical protein
VKPILNLASFMAPYPQELLLLYLSNMYTLLYLYIDPIRSLPGSFDTRTCWWLWSLKQRKSERVPGSCDLSLKKTRNVIFRAVNQTTGLENFFCVCQIQSTSWGKQLIVMVSKSNAVGRRAWMPSRWHLIPKFSTTMYLAYSAADGSFDMFRVCSGYG